MPSFWQRCCCCLPCFAAAADEDEEDQRRRDQRRDGASTPPSDVLIEVHEAGQQQALELQAMLPLPREGSPPVTTPLTGPSTGPAPAMPPAQLARAQELSQWSSEDLGWRVLADPDPAAPKAHFYFNVWTARTVWTPPPRVAALRTLANQTTDLTIPGSLAFVRGMVERLAALDIEVLLWQDVVHTPRAELLHSHDIRGRPPCLLHLLFYAHVLVNELSIYPPSFLRSAGLRHIILVDSLAYGSQRRAAVPLVETGVLLLDPKLEEIIYVVNVLHHEFFHAVDCNMIWRTENHARKHRTRKQQRNAHSNGQHDNGNDDEDGAIYFDFTTAQDPEEAAEPLAPYCLEAAANLHGVPDRAWSDLNPPGFKYGAGGAAERGHDMFLTLGGRRGGGSMAGFLNGYSQTAVEEDKAEVYANLIRDAPSLLRADGDGVLRAKAREMMRRLEWFCADMDRHFWERVRHHTPHPLRPRPPPHAHQDQWVEKTDHLGHRYFFNQATKQTSWVRPPAVVAS